VLSNNSQNQSIIDFTKNYVFSVFKKICIFLKIFFFIKKWGLFVLIFALDAAKSNVFIEINKRGRFDYVAEFNP